MVCVLGSYDLRPLFVVEERSIKKLFFRDQNLILFVLQSLDANALPASLNLEQYDDKKSDYDTTKHEPSAIC